ncbi:MAG: hypothetical protein U0570_10850 [Phycisphaerales bacterium]
MLHRCFAPTALAVVGSFAFSASGAVTFSSRFSEVTRVSWDDRAGNTTEILGTTTAFGSFVVPTGSPSIKYQNSTTGLVGATYSGYTSAWGGTGPPAGSNHYGGYERSRFELIFVVTGTANYTLDGSLQRYFNATSVLRLAPTAPGGSPARTISAAGSPGDGFAPTPVSWTGTLLAGTYKLSIDESGQQVRAGEFSQGSASSFTFVIPSPSAAAVLFGALPLFRRRRSE